MALYHVIRLRQGISISNEGIKPGIRNSEELIKVLYEAQILRKEMETAFRSLRNVYIRAVGAEESQDPGAMWDLEKILGEHQAAQHLHNYLRWFREQIELHEGIVIASNLFDHLAGKASGNYAVPENVGFLEDWGRKMQFRKNAGIPFGAFGDVGKAAIGKMMESFVNKDWDSLAAISTSSV